MPANIRTGKVLPNVQGMMHRLQERARTVEALVRLHYCDSDTDAEDLAFAELRRDPSRTNDEVAKIVAMKILQP